MSIADQIVDFLSAHKFWSGPLSFLLAFLASILGPNFFIPAGSILVSIGTLAGSQLIPWTVSLWATAGAASGSAISFAVGVWLGPVLFESPLLTKRRDLVDRARSLFESSGFAAVLVGYFSGPLRAVVVACAGIAGMKPLRFHAVNLLAAFLWSLMFMSTGAVVGAQVDRRNSMFLLVPVAAPVVLAVVAVGVSFGWRWFWKYSRRNKTSV